jgi:hypothetical protein
MSTFASFEVKSVTVSGGQHSSSSWCMPWNTGYQAGESQSPTNASAELAELQRELEQWDELSDEALTNIEEALD